MAVKVRFADVQRMTLDELECELRRHAKLARAVTIADLTAKTPEQSNGLYFFFEEDALMYVGKSSSVALVQRLPAHFDTKTGAYHACVLKALAREKNRQYLEPASNIERILDMRIAFLTVKLTKPQLTKGETKELGKWLGCWERALINVLRPLLNSKQPTGYVREMTICEIPVPECNLAL
jgi:hypothetical protein